MRNETVKNPFRHFDKAFEPMFDEPILFTMKDGHKQTIKACVFNDITGDAMSDDALDTSRDDIQLIFHIKDMAFLERVKRGDVIERTLMGKKYSVSDSKKDDTFSWIIIARSI